jgi:hypothetical protein
MRPNVIEAAIKAAGKYADGGSLPYHAEAPPYEPNPKAPNDKIVVGPLHSVVAGRTDHLPISVPPGSYVIPADVVSALGEGNTMAGYQRLSEMFKMGPFGAGIQPMVGRAKRAAGGRVAQPIAAAGGEFVVAPGSIVEYGGGDLSKGHEKLDQFVRSTRAKTIETLRKMPGPKK